MRGPLARRPRHVGATATSATLSVVPSVIGPPSVEILALARALIADRDQLPDVPDPLLREALKTVRRQLDDYDKALIDRTKAEHPNERAFPRECLAAAFARRIASAQLALRAEQAERAHAQDDQPAERGG